MVVTALCAALLAACTTRNPDLVVSRETWTVMATELTVSVYRPRGQSAAADLAAAYAEVAAVDRRMSLYKAESELNRLNARAGAGLFPVSRPLAEVLSAARHYADLTGGAFDASIQPLVDLWGFYRVERARVPPPERIDAARRRVGPTQLWIDAQARAAMLKPETRIDLGGIAKGYAVDLALAALRKRGVPAALVNLGGNIGVLGARPDGKPWSIGLQHPRDSRLIGTVELRRGAIATSGDYDRFFEADGKRYSHIIDPRTGRPVEGIAAFTVIAPNATAADALSTAAFVLGAEQGLDLLNGCAGTLGVAVSAAADGGPSATLAIATTAGAGDDRDDDDRAARLALTREFAAMASPRDSTATGIRDCVYGLASDRGHENGP
jgi:thiamine biosynthesis lipoprotein ApbE